MLYYNRLLIGSVVAIIELEEKSKTETHIKHFDLSTRIQQAVWNKLPRHLCPSTAAGISSEALLSSTRSFSSHYSRASL